MHFYEHPFLTLQTTIGMPVFEDEDPSAVTAHVNLTNPLLTITAKSRRQATLAPRRAWIVRLYHTTRRSMP
jgi:hypothetical protein